MPIGYFADFELIAELGRGDLGIVCKARDPHWDRLVALKLLQADARANAENLRQFFNEARAAAWLDHPNFVPIHVLGEHDGRPYIVMKLIGGPSLDRTLGEFAADPEASARLVKTLAEAVHYAHRREALHLALKPSKVLIDESGEPHVTGFSLDERVQADNELTQSDAVLGTPAYLAPEQASGRRGRLTQATDVYGLGAVLYALITGKAPFGADSPAATLALVRDGMPEPPSIRNRRVSHDLEIIVLKCLEKEPERRYSSAAALADDLGRHLDGKPIRDLGAG